MNENDIKSLLRRCSPAPWGPLNMLDGQANMELAQHAPELAELALKGLECEILLKIEQKVWDVSDRADGPDAVRELAREIEKLVDDAINEL